MVAWNAVVSILIKCFPNKVSTIMSCTEMTFGLGYSIGPAIGAILYNTGGFMLPFIIVGSIGFLITFLLAIVFPKIQTDTPENTSNRTLRFRDLIQNFSLILPFLDLFICFLGWGLITSMLQPYLSKIGANSTQVGNTFLIYGIIYMLASPIAGYVSKSLFC